ncbi:UNVERIFIED_CONTAM: hypothetical protein GTU68_026397 [Idotea baltica]|nr:hypothetical protein [Idotea baltica]
MLGLDRFSRKNVLRRKRIGRGPGSGLGKTCGRGHKGQRARSGGKRDKLFVGGQTALYLTLPKFGFISCQRVIHEISIDNVDGIRKLQLAKTKFRIINNCFLLPISSVCKHLNAYATFSVRHKKNSNF